MPIETRSLDDLLPTVRPQFEQLLEAAAELGMEPEIRSAGRTCRQQNQQAGAGHSQVALCRSWHVLGRAVDLNLSPPTCETYTRLGEIWEQMGGVWGGRWLSFGPCGDAGHFQWGDPPGAVGVPAELCPLTATLSDCERIRVAVYDEATTQYRRARLLRIGGAVGAAAVVVGGWLLLRKRL